MTGQKHSPTEAIYWEGIFEKLEKGERFNDIEYKDFRHWYGMNRESGTFMMRLFYKDKSVDLAKESFDHPLWIQIPPYSDDIDSFRSIRNDCKMLSQLFESVDASAHDEQDFKAIEDTVNGVIQGAFTLIGIHEQEHKITEKLHEYEAQAQKRKQAYKEGPGAASAIAGGWTIEAAEQILNTCGGIAGYDALPYGDKKAIRTKIEKVIKDPDGRNVYNILKKIRSKLKQN
jgi:antirestriction protein